MAALDTRLTNAINGGALVSDFKFNLLQTTYTTNFGNNSASSQTATQIGWRSSYPVQGVTRTYATVNGVKSSAAKPAKLYYNITNAGYSATLIMYVNGIQVASGFGSYAVDISQIVSQNPNVTVSFVAKDTSGDGGRWCTVNISDVRISNAG